MAWVYLLLENGLPKYVGETINKPSNRFREHIRQALKHPSTNLHKRIAENPDAWTQDIICEVPDDKRFFYEGLYTKLIAGNLLNTKPTGKH